MPGRHAGAVTTAPLRVLAAHPRSIAAVVAAVAAFVLSPARLGVAERVVLAWDAGALLLLVLLMAVFVRTEDEAGIAANAVSQQDGEWVIFAVTVAGAVASFVALASVLGDVRSAPPATRGLHVALMAATLLLSWTVTHIVLYVR